MKYSAALLLLLSTATTNAFSVPKNNNNSYPSTKLATEQEDNATGKSIIGATGAFFAGMSIAAQVAFANPDIVDATSSMPQNNYNVPSSSIILSSADPFALPSYNEAIKNKNIEVDLESINRATLSRAAEARDSLSVNAENRALTQAVRSEEAEEEARTARLKKFAEEARLEKIEKEKAETRANRWNTF